jgi:hypothetical protein
MEEREDGGREEREEKREERVEREGVRGEGRGRIEMRGRRGRRGTGKREGQ